MIGQLPLLRDQQVLETESVLSFDHDYITSRSQQGGGISSYGLARRSERVLTQLRSHNLTPQRLLDIGTADGAMLQLLMTSLRPTLSVGIDCSFQLLRAAQRSSDQEGRFVRADGRQLPFPSATFDAVVSAATVKHVRKPETLFAEARRVLRQGGCLVISDPTPLALSIGVRRGHFDPRWLANRLTLADWRGLIEPAGFRQLKAERYMMLPWHLPLGESLEKLVAPTPLSRVFLHQVASFEAI